MAPISAAPPAQAQARGLAHALAPHPPPAQARDRALAAGRIPGHRHGAHAASLVQRSPGRRSRSENRLAAILAAALAAQTPQQPVRPLHLEVDPATHALSLRLGAPVADPRLDQVLSSGLPLRLTVRAELWRDRFIDGLVDQETWRAVLLYEPLEGRYRLRISSSPAAERSFRSLEAAGAALQHPVPLRLRPARPGRYYYLATLEVETLSLSDIEELRRWLRGELGPAVSGEREPASALATGLQRLLVRVLGLPARRFEVRTATFEVRGPPP